MGYLIQNSQQSDGVGITIFPILQIGKLRLVLEKLLDQGHTAKQWLKWDLGLLSITPTVLLVQSSGVRET